MECKTYLRNIQDLLSDGKTPYQRRFGEPFEGPIIPFGSFGWVSSYNCEGSVTNPSIWKESLTWIVPWIRFFTRGEFGRVTYWLQTLRSWKRWTPSEIYSIKTQCERGDISQTRRIYFSSRRWTNQNSWRRILGTENTHLDTGSPNLRRKSKGFSWRIRRVSSSTTSRLTSGCRWSDKWLLVHVRKLHVPPSRWTQSQALTPREESFPIPLTYIDVSRTTRTNLDVMQESRIDA